MATRQGVELAGWMPKSTRGSGERDSDEHRQTKLPRGHFLLGRRVVRIATNREDETCPLRLLDASSLQLVDFDEHTHIPPYAILSHRWIEEQEVSYHELIEAHGNPDAKVRQKAGYEKLQKACSVALHLGLHYLWADTCCIDQACHADVHHNIQSMYGFYRNSAVCLVYLHDSEEGDVCGSEWFERGWTLQELVAPQEVLFFHQDWNFARSRRELAVTVGRQTGIDINVLRGWKFADDIDITKRIKWVRGRKTTKPQDLVYCLLRILDVKMGIHYEQSIEETFIELQQKLVQAHPKLVAVSSLELTWTFLAAGHPVPPTSWPQPDTKSCPPRLIETNSLRLVDFKQDNVVPDYAILSHRWIDGDEIEFQEFCATENDPDSKVKTKSGYRKIEKACATARQLGLRYLWIDTCCINQVDANDVALNIRHMYAYYRNSAVCLVYLGDVDSEDITRSDWFRRGWTLQELVAPREEIFFNHGWTFLGSRRTLKQQISQVSKIDANILDGTSSLDDVPVCDRIRWLSGRKTAKLHDLVYCILGLLQVDLEVDYGQSFAETFVELQRKLHAHPDLTVSESSLDLPSSFQAAGYVVPPISWPQRDTEICPPRLIDTHSLRLVNFKQDDIVPEYAILSHRWYDEEVSFREFRAVQDNPKAKAKRSYRKIEEACSIARQLDLHYLWIDTCCVDQADPNDIAVNIRHMYAYYRNSAVCLVYLVDVDSGYIAGSDWFSRGWTLQELVVPKKEIFFNRDWSFLGSRRTLKQQISQVSKIDANIIDGTSSLDNVPVYNWIRWLSGRKTTKPHDLVYCVLGLLRVDLEADYRQSVAKTFVKLQRRVVQAHPDLMAGWCRELTRSFLDAGHLVPTISWPQRDTKICPPRLIDTNSRRFVNFKHDDIVPEYAILSHVWWFEEVSFREFRAAQDNPDSEAKAKRGYRKIQGACSIARQLGLHYLWVDTCCINGEDQDDVEKNIESLYAYYRNSAVCFVYKELWSNWARWPLQDLVTPPELLVFYSDWTLKGSRRTLQKEIAKAGIDEGLLDGTKSLSQEESAKAKKRLQLLFQGEMDPCRYQKWSEFKV